MIFSIILLIILIIINGILSASELAFLSINKMKLKEEVEKGNNKAIIIDRVLKDPSSFLSTIQIGITLSGFLASAFAADYFVDYFIDILHINIHLSIIKNLLLVIITLVLSYITLIFGELVPKKIAISNPEKIASRYVGYIRLIKILFYPLIKILTVSTNFICKILNIKENKNALTEEDIKKMILLGQEEGIIEEKEKEYILNIFNFKDIAVEKVMTPRKDVTMINVNSKLKRIISKIKKEKYTRFPVYENDENNIIGTLNIKDLIINKSNDEPLNIKDIIRPTHRFEYNEKIDDVFRKMQEQNDSICPIYKDNEFIGIVTIEDAVEEIVGNIYDEFDEVEDENE